VKYNIITDVEVKRPTLEVSITHSLRLMLRGRRGLEEGEVKKAKGLVTLTNVLNGNPSHHRQNLLQAKTVGNTVTIDGKLPHISITGQDMGTTGFTSLKSPLLETNRLKGPKGKDLFSRLKADEMAKF